MVKLWLQGGLSLSGNLVVKSKLPPRSGSSIVAVELHPQKGAIELFSKSKVNLLLSMHQFQAIQLILTTEDERGL